MQLAFLQVFAHSEALSFASRVTRGCPRLRYDGIWASGLRGVGAGSWRAPHKQCCSAVRLQIHRVATAWFRLRLQNAVRLEDRCNAMLLTRFETFQHRVDLVYKSASRSPTGRIRTCPCARWGGPRTVQQGELRKFCHTCGIARSLQSSSYFKHIQAVPYFQQGS